MKKSFPLWQFWGFIFTSLVGTLLHFFYDWSNKSLLVAPFSAVNESIWEHLKLLYFPLFIFALIERLYFAEDRNDFWCTKLYGIISGLLLIPILYYTYTGILGVSADWFNIVIFFIAAAFSYLIEIKIFGKDKKLCNSSKTALIILILIGIIFVVFTFIPPEIPLFQDPVTKQYGITT